MEFYCIYTFIFIFVTINGKWKDGCFLYVGEIAKIRNVLVLTKV